MRPLEQKEQETMRESDSWFEGVESPKILQTKEDMAEQRAQTAA
jgi:hypothetical protein